MVKIQIELNHRERLVLARVFQAFEGSNDLEARSCVRSQDLEKLEEVMEMGSTAHRIWTYMLEGGELGGHKESFGLGKEEEDDRIIAWQEQN